jgi:putative copper export protein
LAWFVETVKSAGLLLLLGGAACRYLLAPLFIDQSAARPAVARRTVIVMATGLTLAIAAGIAASQEPVFDAAQLLLAGLFFAAFCLNVRMNTRGLQVVALAAGLVLIGMQAISSHAADESGSLAITSNALHWLAAVAWGGSLLHLMLLPWSALIDIDEKNEAIESLARRYAVMIFAAFALLALSGGLLAFIHVHNADAMNTSAYGAVLKVKMALASILLITVSLHLVKIVPACRAAASADDLRSALRRFRRLLSMESVLLAGMIVAAGMTIFR